MLKLHSRSKEANMPLFINRSEVEIKHWEEGRVIQEEYLCNL